MLSFYGIPLFGYFFQPLIFTTIIILLVNFLYNKYFNVKLENNTKNKSDSKVKNDDSKKEKIIIDEAKPKNEQAIQDKCRLVKIFYMSRTNKSQVGIFIFFFYLMNLGDHDFHRLFTFIYFVFI